MLPSLNVCQLWIDSIANLSPNAVGSLSVCMQRRNRTKLFATLSVDTRFWIGSLLAGLCRVLVYCGYTVARVSVCSWRWFLGINYQNSGKEIRFGIGIMWELHRVCNGFFGSLSVNNFVVWEHRNFFFFTVKLGLLFKKIWRINSYTNIVLYTSLAHASIFVIASCPLKLHFIVLCACRHI